MCLRLFVGFSLILYVFEIKGVQTGASGPVLACHVPLEVKIFADSSYQALSADLKSCTQITLSSVNTLFLSSSNSSLASILMSERRSLELLKQQTPEAEFSFSLRSTHTSPATWNLETIFNRPTSIAHLIEFLRVNKLKSFDIAWDLIQSAPNYGRQLKNLKTTLGKEGFNLTTTIGVEVGRLDAFHVAKIASIVDRIFLVSSYNRHYAVHQYPFTEKEVQQAFDALELNEGAFLKLYSTLNLSWKKIVVGLSLQSLVWKLNLGTIVGRQFSQYQAMLQLQSYYESCKTVNSTWRLQQQPNPFYQLAVAPTNDQWMVHVDPLSLGKRIDLLRQYGFGGVALYDYYQDDFAGICSSKGKMYPLIQQAGYSIRDNSLVVPFPDVDIKNGLCIPFLGLTNECNGAFNFGTPKTSLSSVEFTQTSALSIGMVTKTTLPVAMDSTSTRVPSESEAENVTIPNSSTREATAALPLSWNQMADNENLIRTRRSSVSSSGELGTEPSYSYLKPPGFDLIDIKPRISSPNVKEVELPAQKSLATTAFSSNIITKASSVKVELPRDDQTSLFDTVAMRLMPTFELPETDDNQAAFQESTLSSTNIVSSNSLATELETMTAVESASTLAVIYTLLPELVNLTATEQTVTHLQTENDLFDAPLTFSASAVDQTTDFPIVSSVSPFQLGIDSSLRIEMETPMDFDLQVEAISDVTNYVSDTREDTTEFVGRISTENAVFDVTFPAAENYTLPSLEQSSSVLENNENNVASTFLASELVDTSTTRWPASLDQLKPIPSSQYSDSLSGLLEQTTSDVSDLSTEDHLELLSTMIPAYSATFDITGMKHEAPVLQDLDDLASIQQVTDDDGTASLLREMTSSEPERSTTIQSIVQSEGTASSDTPLPFSLTSSSLQTSSSETSIEYPVTTVSPQALFSSAATESFTKDNAVSDVSSTMSIASFHLVDGPSASATSTDEREESLLSSMSSSSNEEIRSTISMHFSTTHELSSLEVTDNKIQPEDSFSVVTSSVIEWNTSEGTFESEYSFLPSTVFDTPPVKDYHLKYQEKLDNPGATFDYQPVTKEWLLDLKEGSADGSLASTVFSSTLEPILPLSLRDVISTSFVPDVAETLIELSSNSPVGSMTSVEEIPFSIHTDHATIQASMLPDAGTAAIQLADNNFTASEQNSLSTTPEFGTTISSIIDSNQTQFTEPTEEDFSGESAAPYSTILVDDKMMDTSIGYETESPLSSLQTFSNEKTFSDELLPTTSQTLTENSSTLAFNGMSSTLDSILPSAVEDTSSTFLEPNTMNSSTVTQHFEPILASLKVDIEDIQSSNDLSEPYTSTLSDVTWTEIDSWSSKMNLSLAIANLKVSSSTPDRISDEIVIQSALSFSTSIGDEMTDVPSINNEVFTVSSATSLDEQLAISDLSSNALETSTETHFSDLVSNEFHPTFDPILPANLADTPSALATPSTMESLIGDLNFIPGNSMTSEEDAPLISATDFPSLFSPILLDGVTASSNSMAEENEMISSTTESFHSEDSQSNLPIDGAVSSLISFAFDGNGHVGTNHLMAIPEPTGSVLASTLEDESHLTVKGDFSSSLSVSLEPTAIPFETFPTVLMTGSPTSESVSTDPLWLYSSSTDAEVTRSLDGYKAEESSLAVVSSEEQFDPVELSPSDAGTEPEGSSSMSDEFSGVSELPFNLADTTTFAIPMELSTSNLNFLSEHPTTFFEDASTFTTDELSSSFLPILQASTISGTMSGGIEEDLLASTTSRHLEDSISHVPIDETPSTIIPFDLSVSPDESFTQSLIPLETNPSVSMTDWPTSTSFVSVGTSHQTSKDVTFFEPSLSTTVPPIFGEFQILGTDVTTPVEEEFSSSLTNELSEHVKPSFTTDVAYAPSTEMIDTSKSSIVSSAFSTDVTPGTSVPATDSTELILEDTTFPSTFQRPYTSRPILDQSSTSSVLPMDDNISGSGEPLWDKSFTENSRPLLGFSGPLTGLFDDTISTDPPLPYTQINGSGVDVVSSSAGDNDEILIALGTTVSDEQFSIGDFSPNVVGTSTEGSVLASEEFSGLSKLPFDVVDATAFFFPTEGSSHLTFPSENSMTFSEDALLSMEEEFSSSVLPILSEMSSSGIDLTLKEESHISHVTSPDVVDSHQTMSSEEKLASPVPFDISFSNSFEQTQTSLQTNPLVEVTDSLTSASLVSDNISKESAEDWVSFSPSSAEPMLNDIQLLGTGFSTTDEKVVEVSTMASTFGNEGTSDNWISFLEEDGSGVTPGFLNATPSQLTNSISDTDETISELRLSLSSPATSMTEIEETDTVTSSIETTSFREVTDIVDGQGDSFANTAIGFSETIDLSLLPGSSTAMSIALTSPPTTDILTSEYPSSTQKLKLNRTTSLPPPSPPNVAAVSNPGPIVDKVTVSLEPPSVDDMIASSTEMWHQTPLESSDTLVSNGTDIHSLLPTSTTEIQTSSTSLSAFPTTSETLWTSSVPLVEASTPVSSITLFSPTLPSFSSSTLVRSTTSPDAMPSSSTSSASPTSTFPNFSDIAASSTIPPITNLWNLLISRITTANGILSLTMNSTSANSLSNGNTSSLSDEELKGPSTSSMSNTNGNSGNSTFVTRPFWLMIHSSPNSLPAFSNSHIFSPITSADFAISGTATRNTKVPVRKTTTASSTHAAGELLSSRPVGLQHSKKPLKLATNVSAEALHNSPTETTISTDVPLAMTSSQPNFPTQVNSIVNCHPSVRNCTEHVLNSSVASAINAVTDDVVVQLNVTADTADKKRNFSFHLEKLSEVLNQLVASYREIKEEEIQPSAICEAARDSILLKSLFCLNQSLSAMKEKRFPDLVQLIKRLAPAILANLTTAIHLDVEGPANVTGLDIDGFSTTTSSIEPTTSTERTTRSTILTQHSTESFLQNLSTTLLNNIPVSRLPTMLNASIESLMENLAAQLKDTQLADVISAVNRLSHDVPAGFLESLIQQNSSQDAVFFSQTVKLENVEGDMITTEEHRSTSSTTTKAPDIFQKEFWRINRRNPVQTLQRTAGTGFGTLPTIGRYWWDTTKPISSIFRPFAKPALGRP